MGSIWKSLVDIWKGLAISQRITLISTGALTVVLLSIMVWWAQKPNLALLGGGLDPAEAAKISDELRDQKIPFELSSGGRSISVPSHMVYDLRLKLLSKGIMKTGGGKGGVGFELFDKQSFGMSDFLQKANYYRAIQGELERTIGKIEEVESARVLIVAPNERLFSTDKAEVKASVFLQVKSADRLPRQQVNAIRFLVANGVEGLKPSRVSIVDQAGSLLTEADDASSAGLSSSQLEQQKNIETLYLNKVQSMLDQVIGPKQAVVRVSVDMSFDTVQETQERFDPSTTVVRTESTTIEEATNPTRTTGGTLGVSGNTSNASPDEASAKLAANQVLIGTSKKQTANNQYEISKTVQSTLKGAGEIKRISVSAIVNNKRPPGDSVTKEKLENVIKGAIGFVSEGKGKRNDFVAVDLESFSFATTATEAGPIKTDSPVPPAAEKPYLIWLGQALLAGIAIAFLFYFRHLLGTVRSERLKNELSLDILTQVDKAGSGQRAGGASPISVTELSKLIRENPTNMAQALKNWMAQN
jgi:flagellar M-ring protein FliF